MKKFVLFVAAVAVCVGLMVFSKKAPTVHDNSKTSPYGTIDTPTEMSEPVTGTNLSTGKPGVAPVEPQGYWLPPEDAISEEEKEFRDKVVETAGLDRDDPEFSVKLAAIYGATRSDEFPNYETYKLFAEHNFG